MYRRNQKVSSSTELRWRFMVFWRGNAEDLIWIMIAVLMLYFGRCGGDD